MPFIQLEYIIAVHTLQHFHLLSMPGGIELFIILTVVVILLGPVVALIKLKNKR